ncbi:16S rRNA (adenine(1518)-N(6)/adenine(1519)-N(6))-dimethyltransferase RsmA [Thermocrinis sp.]
MRLKKRYGQHLLTSSGVAKKILEVAELREEDVVVEIGPGTGSLTKEILKAPIKELHCLEIDPEMIEELKKFKDDRLRLHQVDASRFDYCKLGQSLKLLGNLPYNVASLIIENTVFCNRCVKLAVFMVQKEVAEKLIEGSSWLGCFVKTFFQVSYIMTVPSRFFLPPPKVQSAVIKLVRGEKVDINLQEYKEFLIRLFSFKRKTLRNKFSEDLLKEASIEPSRRAEELSLDEIKKLFSSFSKSPSSLP